MLYLQSLITIIVSHADMAELADALDLGSSVNRRAGSTPVIRIQYFRNSGAGVEPFQPPVIRFARKKL